MSQTEELAWAAGFFDGEGSITIGHDHRPGKNSYYLKVGVTQKDPRPLLRLQALFGGHIGPSYGTGARNFSLNAAKGAAMLAAIRPYLFVKAEQADVALRFQARRQPNGAGRDIEADQSDRDELRAIRSVVGKEVVSP